jgi:tetratricopeptide (TPR) repeat protein
VGQVSPRNEFIDVAQRQIDGGDFEAAVASLEEGIDQAELSEAQLAEIYRLLGLAHLYLGEEEKARDAFEKLLQARPDYDLPKATPPKIRTLYGRIKDDVRKRRVRPVTLTVAAVGPVSAERAVEISARLENLALGARARLFYRRAGMQSFSSADFVRDKVSRIDYRAGIPAYEVPQEQTSYEIEYYVEVSDAAQRRLAGRGDAFNPLSFQVAGQGRSGSSAPVVTSPPWYQNPWVWLGVGVGVAAATTGLVLVATQEKTGTIPIKIQVDGPP